MKRNPCRNCYHFPRKSIHLEGSCVTISSRPTVSIHSQCKYTDVIPYLQWEGITFRINGQPCVHAFYTHTHATSEREKYLLIHVVSQKFRTFLGIPHVRIGIWNTKFFDSWSEDAGKQSRRSKVRCCNSIVLSLGAVRGQQKIFTRAITNSLYRKIYYLVLL